MTSVIVRKYTAGYTRWGIFTNLWPSALCKTDRRTVRAWYVHVHTPWRIVEWCGTVGR